MDVSEIETRVKRITADHLDRGEGTVQVTDNFVDDLGADSLDNVELVMALEEEFDVEITDDEAEGVATVQNAIDLVAKKLG